VQDVAALSGQQFGNEGAVLAGAGVFAGAFALQHPLHGTIRHPGDSPFKPSEAEDDPDATPGMNAPADEAIRSAITRNTPYFISDEFS
jgi:hypothetical protein